MYKESKDNFVDADGEEEEPGHLESRDGTERSDYEEMGNFGTDKKTCLEK